MRKSLRSLRLSGQPSKYIKSDFFSQEYLVLREKTILRFIVTEKVILDWFGLEETSKIRVPKKGGGFPFPAQGILMYKGNICHPHLHLWVEVWLSERWEISSKCRCWYIFLSFPSGFKTALIKRGRVLLPGQDVDQGGQGEDGAAGLCLSGWAQVEDKEFWVEVISISLTQTCPCWGTVSYLQCQIRIVLSPAVREPDVLALPQ